MYTCNIYGCWRLYGNIKYYVNVKMVFVGEDAIDAPTN